LWRFNIHLLGESRISFDMARHGLELLHAVEGAVDDYGKRAPAETKTLFQNSTEKDDLSEWYFSRAASAESYNVTNFTASTRHTQPW
jgi:hypothetical protein